MSLKISMPKFDDAPISSTAVTKSRTKRGIGNDPITAKLTEHASAFLFRPIPITQKREIGVNCSYVEPEKDVD